LKGKRELNKEFQHNNMALNATKPALPLLSKVPAFAAFSAQTLVRIKWEPLILNKMKTIIYILVFLLPVLGLAQQPWYKSSPLDYMWKSVGDTGFSAGPVEYTNLSFSPSGQPYVVYEDYGNFKKATVMKFDGSNWITIGNAGFSSGESKYTSLCFSPSGQPFVAFNDGQFPYDGRATVMKFDGTSWVNVGDTGFSSGEAWYMNIAFGPADGQPYVCFSDGGIGNKVVVMKFDGTNWSSVGNVTTLGHGGFVSFRFNPSDSLPYVAYQIENTSKATVMKCDGTNWVNVGVDGFTPGGVDFISLAFNPSGQPYVAFRDLGPMKASVMKFDGTNWVIVGNANFTSGVVECTSLAFSPSGQPWVAYDDVWNSLKETVMKFDGTNWVYVGSAGFSAGGTCYSNLAFNPSGQPYVAYEDFDNSNKTTVMKYDSVYVGINEQLESGLSVYPNPTSKSITIDLKNLSGNFATIEIKDLKGIRMFVTKTNEEKVILNVENYPAGIYFVKVKTEYSTWINKVCKD